MQKEQIRSREINFEILRILSMCMVTTLHYLSHSGYLTKGMGLTYGVAWFLETLCLPATDLFILISCYFLVEKDFSLNRIRKTYIRAFVVAIFALIVSFTLLHNDWSIHQLVYLFPFLSRTWGFVNNYLLFLVCFAIVRNYCERLSRKQLKKAIAVGGLLLIVGTYLSGLIGVDYLWMHHGDTAVWFLYVYMIMCYIRKYAANIPTLKAFMLWLIPIIIQFASRIAISYLSIIKWGEVKYAGLLYNGDISPFTLISALGLFFLIKNSHFEAINQKLKKFLLSISMSSFGVYLIQEHPVLRDQLWKFVFSDRTMSLLDNIASWLLVLCCLFFISWILDQVAKFLTRFACKREGEK